jgi:hypothetical protein
MTTTAPPPEALATAPKAKVFTPITTEAEATAANADAEHKLRHELGVSLAGRTRLGVIDALIAGTLHPAITIDWSKV